MIKLRMYAKKSGKRGVAIVIVLGLIAVLMMMAVAFSIHMRIERTGAANYRYGVQARHMVYAGLANAIRDIDDLMTDASDKAIIYPKWDVEASQGTGGVASVLSSSSAAYIPEPLKDVARRKTAKWNTITDINDIQRGRYAFVIVNSSGLLDVNQVGGLARGGGSDPGEIQLEGILGAANVAQFLNRVYNDIRYETFPEFVSKNPFAGNGKDFSMFSLSPVFSYYDIDGTNGQKARIDGAVSSWNEAEIKTALGLSGVTQIDRVYRNMQDWVDEDLVPRRLDEACGEAVPMINEVIVSNEISVATGGAYTSKTFVKLETSFPFPKSSTESFVLDVALNCIDAGTSHPELLPGSLTNSLPAFTASPGFKRFQAPPIIKTGTLSNTNPVTVKMRLDVKVRVSLASGATVDEVPSPYAGATPLIFVFSSDIPFDSTMKTQQWHECVDSRFNWSNGTPAGANGRMWEWSRAGKLTQPSWGAENWLTTNVIANNDPVRQGNYDEFTQAFVGNTNFTRVGELGSIVMAPWTTLRLYAPTNFINNGESEYHKVLDYLTVESNNWQRGLININTTNLDVLAAAFALCPYDEYSSVGTTLPIDQPGAMNDALDLAEEIINGGQYVNLSELGAAGVVGWKSYTAGVSSDFERESLIRNTAGLLTARDNYFTVIIRADSFSAGVGGKVNKGMSLATSRAVAEIWRDPIPDDNGNHKCFIRSFRFVED